MPLIKDALISLVRSDLFFADILMRLNRVYSEKQVPTAGVSLANGGTLYINPTFWKENSGIQKQILMHECLHLLLDHIGRSKDGGWSKLANVAADLSINCIIPNFPDEVVINGQVCQTATVNNYRKIPEYAEMEHGKSYEYYLEFLRSKSEGEGSGEGGPKTMDDHEKWVEGRELTPEEAREVVRDIVSRAAAASKNAGQSVPDSVRAFVEQLFHSGISWEEILRSVPEACEISHYESSRKKRNRRYGLDFPGEKVVRKCEVVVGFDVSGSITDEIVTKFSGVLNEISQKANVRVLFFDHAIQQEIEYTEGCLSSGQIPGGGGTLFEPVFSRAKELNADALIMLTDGMMADSFERPHFPTFWGILEGYNCPVDWGTVVTVK